jgi:tRNA-2-methylthio-N6-dimethylallyladenosine synthase
MEQEANQKEAPQGDAASQSSDPCASKDRPGVFIKTFGCQMNEYDTQKLHKILENKYRKVDRLEDASLVVVNTCSVRDKPEQKLYSLLGELRDFRKEHQRDFLIGVGGCVAQQEGQRILERSSAVDFVFGTHNLSVVPSLVQSRLDGLPPQVAVDYREEWEELPLGLSGEGRVSVFVSISRGCNKNCTYCIVPTTRGPEASRALDEILREVRIAVHRGAREVVLLGQTVNSYGLDFSPRIKFSELLRQVAEVPGLERIRFTSPHPQEIKEDFVELVANNPKVCRHVHMPLQSGSDKILKLMNRNYRRKRYLEIINSLKAAVPNIALTTDIIVGFPGETEEDFLQTMEILEEVRFDACYSFMFSPRPGTAAAAMEDDVPAAVKLERLKRLQQRQDEITTEILHSWVGKEAEVLLEGPTAANPQALQGRISQNIVVNLDQHYPRLAAGQLVKVAIVATARFTLRGEPLEYRSSGGPGLGGCPVET